MAEDLIKVREAAEIEGNSSELNNDALTETESYVSVSSIPTSDHASPISNLGTNKDKSTTSFDDPSWLEGLFHGEIEISSSSNKNIVTNGPLQTGNCDLIYCYITDKGQESSDQNDAEVDIDNGVSYLAACVLGK